ncbi:DUF2982 domain-containing protein [Dongshaea marina]|uniref:DUF2982 domain-containing protein n=1 Tax=Dongshaea marina TaxID=2047966 RepID=UPI000D3EBDD5|nr:DUF2982 domain-containing protein [Dongshaea marina]
MSHPSYCLSLYSTTNKRGLYLLGFSVLPLLPLLMPLELPVMNTLLLLGAACCLIGAAIILLMRPKVLLQLTNERLYYLCGFYHWSLRWSNIKKLHFPPHEYSRLNCLALELKDHDELLQSITPETASWLLAEQRPALLSVMHKRGIARSVLFEQGQFRSHKGHTYHGVIAMLGWRMQKLQSLTGCGLWITSFKASSLGKDQLNAHSQKSQHQGATLFPERDSQTEKIKTCKRSV